MNQAQLSLTLKELIDASIVHPIGRGKVRIARAPAKLIMGIAGSTAYSWDNYLCRMEAKPQEWSGHDAGQVRYARNANSILKQLASQCLTGIKIDDLLVGLHYMALHFDEYDISQPSDHTAYIKKTA